MKSKKIKVQYIWRSITKNNTTRSTPVPAIRMEGKWLEQIGFHIGDRLLVSYEDGKIILQNDSSLPVVAESSFYHS